MKKISIFLITFVIFGTAIWLSSQGVNNKNADTQAATGDLGTEQTSLNMAIFPRRVPQVTRKAFQPLANYLQVELGKPVNLITPATYKKFWKGVTTNQYDIVHFNQYHYIESHKLPAKYQAILANEEGHSRTISGAIFVKSANHEIRNLTDLKGKTIIFGGGKKAMVSYIASMALLKRAGLKQSDFTTMFSKNPPFAIVDAFMNKGEAAAAGAHLLGSKSVKKRIGAKGISKMRILAVGEPITHLPWAVKDSMPVKQREHIRSAMTSLKTSTQGREILKAAMVSDFYAVSDKDYDKSREMVEFVTGKSY